MKADKEAFMYPKVNDKICVDCGMCVKVCPVINECENKEPYLKSYGGYSKDEHIINSCASGGVATALSFEIIKQEAWYMVSDSMKPIVHRTMCALTRKRIYGHFAVLNMYNLRNRAFMRL